MCGNNGIPGVCAFVSDDGICKKPSRAWKKKYHQLLEKLSISKIILHPRTFVLGCFLLYRKVLLWSPLGIKMTRTEAGMTSKSSSLMWRMSSAVMPSGGFAMYLSLISSERFCIVFSSVVCIIISRMENCCTELCRGERRKSSHSPFVHFVQRNMLMFMIKLKETHCFTAEAQAECRFMLLSPNNLLKPSDVFDL